MPWRLIMRRGVWSREQAERKAQRARAIQRRTRSPCERLSRRGTAAPASAWRGSVRARSARISAFVIRILPAVCIRASHPVDVVVRMAQAGLLGFLGAGGLRLPAIEAAILEIQSRISRGAPYGINFIAHTHAPEREDELADLLMKLGVTTIEASAFMQVTPALVRYRAKGLAKDGTAFVVGTGSSRRFRVRTLLSNFCRRRGGNLSRSSGERGADAEDAALARQVPVADAICVEADSGGHTDQRMPLTLLPAILMLRRRVCDAHSRGSGACMSARRAASGRRRRRLRCG